MLSLPFALCTVPFCDTKSQSSPCTFTDISYFFKASCRSSSTIRSFNSLFSRTKSSCSFTAK